jgi:pimeloyl-ACP methyl ester carboxylesterase
MTKTGSAGSIRDSFEQKRLAFMTGQGFECEPQRIIGRTGRSTYVMTSGEGTPSRVLIHGGLSEGSVWGGLAGRLNGRIVVADRPGCGLSDPVDYRKVDTYRDAAAQWVGEVADGLGERQIDVVGNSMGGYFAIAFALANPERVRRLILAGGPAGLPIDVPLFIRLWGNPIAEKAIRRMKFKDVDSFRNTVYPTAAAHPERIPDELAEIEFAAGNLPGFSLTSYTMFRSITTLRGWRSDFLIGESLTRLDKPTLFVWGDADAAVPLAMGRSLTNRMSKADLRVIQEAGHLPWLDEPVQVAQVINEFLGRRPSPNPR